jgi:alpha-L-fucosidase
MLKPKPTAGDTSWFVRDRFGMFIHWGTYAAAARHEWVQNYEKIAGEDYRKYFEHFDPDLYDPKAWAKAAKNAGMKYFVITTKHHEGFCLWDSQFTDFKAPNAPVGKDLLTPMVEAFRAEGLRVGFYYSLIDWHHPHFPLDVLHPEATRPDAQKMNEGRDVKIYAEYMRNQVRELLTNFGEIDILWFDFSYAHYKPQGENGWLKGKGKDDWESEKLLQLVRELAPKAMVNNRLDLPDIPADMHTPEQFQPSEWIHVDGEPVVWEACQTLSGSWGYHRDETTWKSAGQLIRMLIDTVSKGGNLLMNVGPTARGVLDYRALNALQTYGDWMQWNSRSIYGCTQAEYSAPTDVRYTQNFQANRLYVHLFAYPFKHLHLPHLAGKVEYAQFLHDASEIQFREMGAFEHAALESATPDGALTLNLPVVKPNVEVPVIELFLK